MIQQSDTLSPFVALARNLGNMTIERSGEFVSCQIDHVEYVIKRCGKQLHAVLPKVCPAPETWDSEAAMEKLIGGSNNLFRELIMAGIDYQMEMLRLMQDQASDAQQAISDALREQMAKVDTGLAGNKRSGKGNAIVQKLAA